MQNSDHSIKGVLINTSWGEEVPIGLLGVLIGTSLSIRDFW